MGGTYRWVELGVLIKWVVLISGLSWGYLLNWWYSWLCLFTRGMVSKVLPIVRVVALA